MEYDKIQKEVIESDSKNILVIAGAGGAKTTTLIGRINYLLSIGVQSEEIAAITFTNIAAQEMRSRIQGEFKGYVGTIHSLATKVLQENDVPSSVWYGKKDKFDELLLVGAKYVKKRYNYILVDELQDIADDEYNFIKAIHADSYFFVGDDYQSLYKFKGANEDIFFDLIASNDFKKYYLLNNYRSYKQISYYGYNIISNVKKKCSKYMQTKREGIGTIYSTNLKTAITALKKDGNYKDWLIVTRLNKEVDEIGAILTKNNIPFVNFKKSQLDYEKLTELMESDTVKLLTIHSAKGLESKNVIVYKANLNNKDDELKVAYVAATRAKENLYWCCPIILKNGSYSDRYLNSLSVSEDLWYK